MNPASGPDYLRMELIQAPAVMDKTQFQYVPLLATEPCDICERDYLRIPRRKSWFQQHHIIPVSEWKNYPDSDINATVGLCQKCHTAVHSRWTNAELAACPWEETRFLMRNVCA